MLTKNWKYGFSIQRPHSSSSERSKVNLRIASPAISRVGKGGMPGQIGRAHV